MIAAVTAIGFLICLVSFVAAVSPRELMKLVEGLRVSTTLRILAAVVRIGIGVLLVLSAPLTSYSLTLEIIGVLLVVIGVIVLFLNNSMVQTLVDLVTKTEPFTIRIGRSSGSCSVGSLSTRAHNHRIDPGVSCPINNFASLCEEARRIFRSWQGAPEWAQ